jgi:alkylhydroperoxidase family enzyme
LGIEKPLARKLVTDWEHAPVEPKVMELFRFAAKLTRHPGDISGKDIEVLREAGWDDEAIYETVLTASAMGLFNRVSLGLGLVADL